MLTSINVKFIFESACLGDKGLVCSANVFQIADVVGRVVFLRFLLCFQPIVHLFLPRETSEMFRHFIGIHYQKPQPRLQVFSVNSSMIWRFCCTIEVISSHIAKFFQIWSTVAGYDELCVEFNQKRRNIVNEQYFYFPALGSSSTLSKHLELQHFSRFSFFTVEYHVFRCLTPVNGTPSLYKCSTPEKCGERERYVRCSLFAPSALFPTQPILFRHAKVLPKGRGRSVGSRDKNGCKGGYPLHRLSTRLNS